jgi:hypothetical protein
MVHTLIPSSARRSELLNSIANDEVKMNNYNAIAREKLKENNKIPQILDPTQKNKQISTIDHPLLQKIAKKRG